MLHCFFNHEIICDREDEYGACYFCDLVNDYCGVQKISLLETESLYSEDEDS